MASSNFTIWLYDSCSFSYGSWGRSLLVYDLPIQFYTWAPTEMSIERSQNCSGLAAIGFFQIFSWQQESSSCSYEEPICFCWSSLGRKLTCLKIISKDFLKSWDMYGVGNTWNSKKELDGNGWTQPPGWPFSEVKSWRTLPNSLEDWRESSYFTGMSWIEDVPKQ